MILDTHLFVCDSYVHTQMKSVVIAKGRIEVNNGVRLVTRLDFCAYYRWLIGRNMPWVRTQVPMHGAHITICNPKIHKITDYRNVNDLHGKTYFFEYYPEELYRSPKNFWIPANTDAYDVVKSRLGFVESKNWWGLHLTVCNMKFDA